MVINDNVNIIPKQMDGRTNTNACSNRKKIGNTYFQLKVI
jgi:hypothetical protein